MSSSDPDLVFQLFDQYAAAYARNERPRARDYLDRAGDRADELAELLDGFLRRVPRGAPDPQTVALMGAWLAGEPPLVRLRVERGIRVDDVVKALVEGFRLDPAKRAKVKRLYQELEKGLLEPSTVSAKLWDALGRLLGPAVTDARRWRPSELRGAAVAFYRRSEPLLEADVAPATATPPGLARPSAAAREEPPDEIDRLFGVT